MSYRLCGRKWRGSSGSRCRWKLERFNRTPHKVGYDVSLTGRRARLISLAGLNGDGTKPRLSCFDKNRIPDISVIGKAAFPQLLA